MAVGLRASSLIYAFLTLTRITYAYRLRPLKMYVLLK